MLDKSEQAKRTKAIIEIRKENFDSDKIIRDIRTFFESEEDYYEPIKINSAFNDNYIEYQNRDKDKTLSIEEYLDVIKQYLSNIIHDHKTQDEWKIQLTLEINFISYNDSKETRTMYTTSNNIEIMISYETDEIIEELFKSLFQKSQAGLKKSMKGSEFVFDSVDLSYYQLPKIGLTRGGSDIDSPEWLKNKKATVKPINKKDDKCFQYVITVALNHEQILKKSTNNNKH